MAGILNTVTARREFVVDKPDIQTIGEKTQFEQAETDIPRAHDALETANMSRANVRANIAVCWGKTQFNPNKCKFFRTSQSRHDVSAYSHSGPWVNLLIRCFLWTFSSTTLQRLLFSQIFCSSHGCGECREAPTLWHLTCN